MDRRKFVKNAGVAAAATFTLPRFSIASSKSPNEKINIACVGVGGIGAMTFNGVKGKKNIGLKEAQIIAVSDVDPVYSKKNYDKFAKGLPMFADYREMFDKLGKDIDAVCVSTPDHTHFKITMDAMSMGKHVAVQKPLTHDIWQARELKKAKAYYKVKTQMMNQGHATSAIRMIREWYETGITGPVREVHVMCGGPNWKSIYFKKPEEGLPLKAMQKPDHVAWDCWLGQAKETPYNKILHPLSWRSFWDFGTGMLGNWFCHTGDAPVWCLDLKDPVSVELLEADCSFDRSVFIPNASIVKWTFPKTDKHPELAMYWYDGGLTPKNLPHDWDKDRDLKKDKVGMLMVGDKCTIETGVRPNFNPRLANTKLFADFKKNLPAKTIPRVRQDNLYLEWFDAIKGNIAECGSNFDYASQLTEVALLGSLAQRLGGKIEWDAKNMRSPNRPEASQFIRETPRKGWEAEVPRSFLKRVFG